MAEGKAGGKAEQRAAGGREHEVEKRPGEAVQQREVAQRIGEGDGGGGERPAESAGEGPEERSDPGGTERQGLEQTGEEAADPWRVRVPKRPCIAG